MSNRLYGLTRCLRYLRPDHLSIQLRRASSNVISPTILERARAISDRHAILAKQLAKEYDTTISKEVNELSKTASRLKEYDEAIKNYDNLLSMYGEDKEINALIDEEKDETEQAISKSAQALTHSLIPTHPFAHLPCLLEIKPGAGGDEASIFAGDLLRMYQAFCSRHGYSTNLLSYDVAEQSGSTVHVQEAILEIKGAACYGVLRCETGVHRVQRVPLTESKGRTHTSAVSVLVLPSIPASGEDLGENDFDDPRSDYYVNSSDVKTDVMRARGAGGQHVNTTDSAVRLTHIPTGTVVAVQESRSQLKNREIAWNVLRSRIAQQRRDEREAEIVSIRRGAGAGKIGRENKIRTYNYGQQRVTDHRSGFESRRLNDVMEGGEPLDDIMDSVRSWMTDEEVLALTQG